MPSRQSKKARPWVSSKKTKKCRNLDIWRKRQKEIATEITIMNATEIATSSASFLDGNHTSTPITRDQKVLNKHILSVSDASEPQLSPIANSIGGNKIADEYAAAAPSGSTSCSASEPQSSADISESELVVENISNLSVLQKIKEVGFRIVHVDYFDRQMQQFSEHGKGFFNCGILHMRKIKEVCYGFRSCITYHCDMCNKEEKIWTSPEQKDIKKGLEVNTAIVLSALTSGISHNTVKEFLGGVNMPVLSSTTYYTIHDKIEEDLRDASMDEMLAAGLEEKEIAERKGQFVDLDDGRRVPWIAVKVDGSWQKRTFKAGNYSSLVGNGVIVGAATKKVLFVGVRCKYCGVCEFEKRKVLACGDNPPPPRNHKCCKNWGATQSSGAMEASIIAEGFSLSLEMHGLVYKVMIGDGDSNTYNNILNEKPYGSVVVEKIECKAHLWRVHNTHVNNLVKTSKDATTGVRYPVVLRKVIGSRRKRLRPMVNKWIKLRIADESKTKEEKADLLYDDVENSLSCIYNDHSKCDPAIGICGGEDLVDQTNYKADLKLGGLWEPLSKPLHRLQINSASLLVNEDTNVVEMFNSLIAKQTMHKSKLFSRTHKSRIDIAVVSVNQGGKVHDKLCKKISQNSPGSQTKKMELERQKKNRPAENKKSKRKLSYSSAGDDKFYGPKAAVPPLDGVVLKKAMESKLTSFMAMTDSEREKLEKETRLQADSPKWIEAHNGRLTASNHGPVCTRTETNSSRKLVCRIMYSNLSNLKPIMHGKRYEKMAIQLLAETLDVQINPAGLVVCKNKPYLAASPDGYIGEDTVVEVKCLWKARFLSPLEAVLRREITYIIPEKIGNNSYNFRLNKNHSYYKQVQSQLHYTEREKCIFAIYTLKAPHILYFTVERDEEYYKTKMEPKLEKFYKDCMLPEIVDPLYPKRKIVDDIREPSYVISKAPKDKTTEKAKSGNTAKSKKTNMKKPLDEESELPLPKRVKNSSKK